MYIVKEKRANALKTALIAAGIAMAVAAAIVCLKKKKESDRLVEEELDDEIGIAFAEEDFKTADVKIVDCEEA